MKNTLSIVKTTVMFGTLLFLLMLAVSCSNKSGGSSEPAGTVIVTVQANPASITANGTSTITATITDSNGNPVPDGTSVIFSMSTSTYGSLSNSTVTTAGGVATTTFTAGSTSGSLMITATSGDVSNSMTLTIGTVPGGAAATGSIQFISATPQVIGIKGAGQPETSTIQFLVNDLNGNPVDGASVSFTMAGPNGGEYIGDIDSTPNTFTASTVSGNVSVILHSGSIAGTVTIVATTSISGVPISTSATPLSIGGGIPSATHFTLARTPVNLQGYNSWVNLQSIVNAFVADRFGNYNVLTGTVVSFYTEAGAIDRQGITGEDINDACHGPEPNPACNAGAAGALIRTQNPMPQDVLPVVVGNWLSDAYFDKKNEPYYTSGGLTYNPRDGWVTVLAATRGEETFLDENLDGLFTRSYKNDKCPYSGDVICECDGGVTGGYAGYVLQGEKCTDAGKPGGMRSEGFIDLPEDPFYDVNDDGLRDDGQTLGYPFELYIDSNQNGAFDSTNGKWDGPDCQTAGCNQSKTIWTDTKIVFSGGPEFIPSPDVNNCYNLNTENPACNATYCDLSYAVGSNPVEFAVAPPLPGITKGGSGSFTIIVGDYNLNRLQGGTTITVTASALATAPSSTATTSVVAVIPSEYTVLDGGILSPGPTSFDFTVNIPVDTTADSTTVTVEVTTPNGTTRKTSIKVPLI